MNLFWMFSRQARGAAKTARLSRLGKTQQRTQLIHLALAQASPAVTRTMSRRTGCNADGIEFAAGGHPVVKPGNAWGRQCKGNRQNFPKL
jgi:hypothetical protein